MKRIGIYIVIVVCILSCISSRRNLLTETRLMLVDTRATEHTAALFYNLRQLTGKRVVYGQHNYEMGSIRIVHAGGMRQTDVMRMM